jgi:hypothetical protein
MKAGSLKVPSEQCRSGLYFLPHIFLPTNCPCVSTGETPVFTVRSGLSLKQRPFRIFTGKKMGGKKSEVASVVQQTL